MKRVVFYWLFFLLYATAAQAQDFSNKGKDFWIGYGYHIRMGQPTMTAEKMQLYITSDVSTTGQVEIPGLGFTQNFTVTANQITTIDIPRTAALVDQNTYNLGIHVTALKPVVVYSFIYVGAVSGATVCLPTNTLGKEYYSVNFKQISNETSFSYFFVIATDTGTTSVDITPSAATKAGQPANTTFSVTLTQGQIYQVLSSTDLTGSKIISRSTATGGCKKIGVYCGSGKISIGCNDPATGSSDNLYQQIYPTAAWGKDYITTPSTNNGSNFQTNFYRIIRPDPATIVKLNGTIIPATSFVNNFYYQFNGSTTNFIQADKPIMVAQYFTTSGGNTALNCGNSGIGDPEMIYLNPLEQTITNVTLNSMQPASNTNITTHFLNVVLKNAPEVINTFKIDGVSYASSFTPVSQNTGYAYARIGVASLGHTVTCDSGFNAIAYGFGNAESYGYSAGTNLRDLYQFVSIENQYATVAFPATCRATPFYFSMTFPYQPTQIQWLFNGLFPDVTLTNPVPDSTWTVNGKPLYRYKLPNPYVVANIGTYPIKVLAQNPTPDGCGSAQEINYDLQVFERPVADFTIASSGCVTDAVQFTNTSNTGGRPAIAWSWNFGDGGIAATSNAAHLYTAPNTYTVRYSIITDIGCLSDTVPKTVTLTPVPQAKFGYSALRCAGKAVTFTDSSAAMGSTLVKWYWDFGDGSAPVVATNGNPQTHVYTASNTYTVMLKVENASGCQSLVFSQQVPVNPLPVPAFTFGQGCLPQAVIAFANATTIPDGTQAGLSYAWRFGDGGTASVASPVHTYVAAGPFPATLTVTSAAGCVDSLTKSVNTIHPQPSAAFSANAMEVCLGASIQFTDNSTVGGGAITQWLWIFDDGTTATVQNPSKTYATADTFQVKLVAYSAEGCPSDTARKTVIVNPLPTALFAVSNPRCETKNLLFTDASAANAGSLASWTWNLGDGTTLSSGGPHTHIYSTAGTYNASLQVTTSKGCVSAPFPLPVVVHPQPRPGFSMPGNCLTDPFTQFTDTSSIADGTESQFLYAWNFGDANATPANPNTSTQKNPQHKFTAVGPYNVNLAVTSGAGCTASIQQVFTINGTTPQSAFSFAGGNAVCSNEAVVVQNNSSLDFGALVKLEVFWDAANDLTNKTTILNPPVGGTISHLYPVFFTPATKTHTVRVVAYSGDNCFSSSQQILTVKATPLLAFGAIPSICADVAPFPITQASVLNGMTGTGIFSGPGVSAAGLFNPAVATIGTDTLRYVFTATNSCRNEVAQAVMVFPVPTVSAGPDLLVLAGGTGQLTGTASGNGLGYTWSPATWLSNASILQPTVTPEDEKTYTLTVTSTDGCAATDAVLVKVLKAPLVPNVFTPNGDGVNDKWVIQYLDSYPAATVEVYNRYGQQVYRSQGYAKPWDGLYNGKPLPVGTYYYLINPRNGRQQMSGFVDLLR